jgi:predicted dehydrogenase
MTFAFVGLGNACLRGHLPAVERLEHARASILGAADPDPDRRAILAARLPTVPTFPNLEALLSVTTPDALVVATDPRQHASLVVEGIEHGCHVICEKPLTLTRQDHERIAAACERRSELALVPVHQYRYSPEWTRIRRLARWASRLRMPYSLTASPAAAAFWPTQAFTSSLSRRRSASRLRHYRRFVTTPLRGSRLSPAPESDQAG